MSTTSCRVPWRPEGSTHDTPFNVTFEFRVANDLPDLSLEFGLPDRIILRGKPELVEDKSRIRRKQMIVVNPTPARAEPKN